eukprot:TRINITY_DN12360_c0_g1_i3.p1 TRINITY_DN12360_c0_g1~~TRINITY_DN12360_c0_g1_i3.p1  ORF type:complete len:224 (-),score=48.96 TRINITY_DN12360_c0_g1_i3:377-1048(-)
MANAGGRPILLDADHMDGFDKRLDMSPRSAARAYRNLLRGEDLLKCVRQEREDESEKWTAWQILQPKVADLRSPARASSARRRIAEKPQTPRRLQGHASMKCPTLQGRANSISKSGKSGSGSAFAKAGQKKQPAQKVAKGKPSTGPETEELPIFCPEILPVCCTCEQTIEDFRKDLLPQQVVLKWRTFNAKNVEQVASKVPGRRMRVKRLSCESGYWKLQRKQ